MTTLSPSRLPRAGRFRFTIEAGEVRAGSAIEGEPFAATAVVRRSLSVRRASLLYGGDSRLRYAANGSRWVHQFPAHADRGGMIECRGLLPRASEEPRERDPALVGFDRTTPLVQRPALANRGVEADAVNEQPGDLAGPARSDEGMVPIEPGIDPDQRFVGGQPLSPEAGRGVSVPEAHTASMVGQLGRREADLAVADPSCQAQPGFVVATVPLDPGEDSFRAVDRADRVEAARKRIRSPTAKPSRCG